MLAAEDRLLAAGNDTTGPVAAPIETARQATAAGPDSAQAAAVSSLVTSGRVADVLVGPAGAGKSTAMAELRRTWEATYGPGSVTGLAPSAAAARVLGDETGVTAETTAQWVAQQAGETRRLDILIALQRRREQRQAAGIDAADLDAKITDARATFDRWRMKPGQLVIVDEASMADTKTLDALVTQVRDSGAKIVLVGDPAQLSAVGAGGGFAMLTHARTDTPELGTVRRFKNPDGSDNTAEAAASIQLRDGDPRVLDYYQQRGRIHTPPDGADPLDSAYHAWKVDRQHGLDSLLIAGDNATVTALNQRAHDDLAAHGHVDPGGITLADGTAAAVGDRIITRKVERHLPDGTARARRTHSGALTAGYVTNGAAFTVTDTTPDGGLVVTADRGTPVLLPAEYAARHVQLGYAVTAHRAQGATVDTAHVIAGPGMTGEAFYVAMTRGRHANHAHVITDTNASDLDRPGNTEKPSSRAVLEHILTNTGQQLSARETQIKLTLQVEKWRRQRELEQTQPTVPVHEPAEQRRGPPTAHRTSTARVQAPKSNPRFYTRHAAPQRDPYERITR